MRIAVHRQPFNPPAVMDLIRVLLSSPKEHQEELEFEFQNALSESNQASLTNSMRGQILFAKGCMKFMLGEKTEAVKLWMEALELKPSIIIFKVISNFICKFKMVIR